MRVALPFSLRKDVELMPKRRATMLSAKLNALTEIPKSTIERAFCSRFTCKDKIYIPNVLTAYRSIQGARRLRPLFRAACNSLDLI